MPSSSALLAPSLAVLGGGLLALSGAPFAIPAAGFASLVLLLEALERSRGTLPVLRAAWTGLLFGAAVNAVALYSLGYLLQAFGGMGPWLAWPLAGLAFLAQGLPYAATGALSGFCVRLGMPRWLTFPACLVLAEYLTPQLFPWRPSAPQVNFLWFVQIADLGGEALLDACMAAVAGGLWHALRPSQATSAVRMRAGLLGGMALLIPCAYGAVRLPQVRSERARAQVTPIGVVQSNVGIALKHDESRAAQILQNLKAMTAALEQRGSSLTIWAETAYPYFLLRSRAAQPEDERSIVDRRVRGPVLIGAVTYQGKERLQTKYNSAWLVRERGTFGDRVDKSRLIPFGEFIPFWNYLPPLQEAYASHGFEAGENDIIRATTRANEAPVSLGILICYEDLFAGLARKVVLRGADILVNMTNDAWFGQSHEPALHNMVAQLRAVETRRDLVRVVNTGVSSFTSAAGETIEETSTFTRSSFVAQVRPLTSITLYTAWGDWVPLVVSGLLVAGALRVRLRRSP